MVFSSLLFLFRFLPLVLAVYYLLPPRFRNTVLLLFSLAFYAWGEPVYILLMIGTILVSYTGGILVGHFQEQGKEKEAKITVILSSVISLSFLFFFKYAGFAAESINTLTGASLAVLKLSLPIGISFYTFQTMSYTIDVYRKEARVQKNLISFGAYVAMFPQLIAGPIVQYKTIDEQLRNRKETAEQFAYGIHRFVIGLGKKLLLANNAGAIWDSICAMQTGTVPVVTAWMGLAAYTFQIYFDFSAYSDMAIGLGHMFGFRFLENFQYPYISLSITEFWRRWHISLSTWFRDYVYIPLGGNRVGKAKQIRNIMVVWMLTGIWHGASWNFVAWGLYYGILLILEKLWFHRLLEKVPSWVKHCYCMFFVMLGWNLFAFDSLTEGLQYMKMLFGAGNGGFFNTETIYLLYNHAVLFVLLILGSTRIPAAAGNRIMNRLKEKDIPALIVRGGFYLMILLLSVAWLVNASYNPFLYFRF